MSYSCEEQKPIVMPTKQYITIQNRDISHHYMIHIKVSLNLKILALIETLLVYVMIILIENLKHKAFTLHKVPEN